VATLVERAGLLPQAEIMLVRRHRLPASHTCAIPSSAQRVAVFGNQPAGKIVEGDTKWIHLNAHLNLRGTNLVETLITGELRLHRGPVRFDHRPRIVGTKRRSLAQPDTNQVGSQHRDAGGGSRAAKCDLIAFGRAGRHPPDFLPRRVRLRAKTVGQ